MDAKDRVASILRSKVVHDDGGHFVTFQLEQLLRTYPSASEAHRVELEIYPVKAIALLEVFTRSWATRIANKSSEFAHRAVTLVQNVKLDYHLVLGITADTITFGDIVGYAISINRVDQILSVFSTLCGEDIGEGLRVVVSRRETELFNKPSIPLIGNYDDTMAAVAGMFEMRHVICHEAPQSSDIDTGRIKEMLGAVCRLAAALNELLLGLVYGKFPLTQSGMNQAAYDDYKEAEKELQDVLRSLKEQYRDHPRRIKVLRATQRTFERYVRLQSIFVHDPVGGGTIGPMLRSHEAARLTRERLDNLKSFVGDQYR